MSTSTLNLIAKFGFTEIEYYEPMTPLERVLYNYLDGEGSARSYLLKRYDPKIDDKQLSFIPGAGEKRRSGKPGRMAKQMIPHLSDHILEGLTIEIKNGFMMDTSQWNFEINTSNFYDVYLEDNWARQVQLETTRDCKAQEDSCMRYEFDSGMHPTSAFESGDFELFSLQDEDDQYVARVLVRKSNKTRGPIYVNSDTAYNEMLSHCLRLGVTLATDGDWVGARLVWQETDYEPHLASGPYLDVAPKYGLYDPQTDSDYIYITEGFSNVDLTAYEGTLSAELWECDECDGQFTYREDREHGCCESCAENLELVECDLTGDGLRLDAAIEMVGHDGQPAYTHPRYRSYLSPMADGRWAYTSDVTSEGTHISETTNEEA